MPLTPEDVQNKRFTVVRFKFGYDEEEVDTFLDEIEEELRRLVSENKSLREAATRASGTPSPTAMLPPAAPPASGVQPPPAPVSAPPEEAVTGLPEMDNTALRTLMLAQRTAEDAISKAHADAEEIVAEAKGKATALEQELRAAHATRLAALEKERTALVEEIAALRGFEREFRSRLRTYLQSTISDLDARPSVEPTPAQPVAAARAAAEAQSIGRHSAPLPSRGGAPAGPAADQPQPPLRQPAPPQPAGQPPSSQPPASPPPGPPPSAPPSPAPASPAPPTAVPPAAVPPVAPPASPPPAPNPFSPAPPPAGPPTQA